MRLVPFSLCSASSLYTGLTEFEYLAQPISSLWLTICVSLNKQDTDWEVRTGNAGSVSFHYSSPLLCSTAWYPFSGRNAHFFVSSIISLFYLVPPFSLSDVLSSSIFISLCSSSHVQMKKSSDDWATCVRGEHTNVCVQGTRRRYVERFKDWKVRMVNCLSVHESH